MPRKGYKFSDEARKNMSEAHKGQTAWNKGVNGYKRNPCSSTTKKKMSEAQKGKHNSVKTQFQIGHNGLKGEKNPSWKGGITPINTKIRDSKEYRIWREAVFKRDNYTCIWCNQVGGKLHADHIKPFAHYPELRFAIDNGRTLCKECHKTTDTYAGKSKK